MDFDRDKDIKRKPNPKLKANCFSFITFFYTYSLLKQGRKTEIEEKDIYEVMPKFKSSQLGDKLENEWKKHENPTNSTIIKVLWACFGKYYLFLGVIQFFMKTLVVFVQPRALAKLISYFTADTKLTQSDAYYYAAVLIVLNLVNVTYVHNYMMLITELGIQVKTAFCSLIYRKALNLNQATLSDITIGKIVTLISKDVNNFDSILIFLNDIWISVLILIITTVLIYIKVGTATFAGVLFLLTIIPLQIYIGKLTSQFRITASKTTDQRIQYTQETLSAIKIIKMYTWENWYHGKISQCRKEEIDKIKKIYYSKATSLIIGGMVISVTMYIIVSVYTNLGNYFTAEVAFYLLQCLQTLRSVVMVSIPLGIAQSAELMASLSRINKLLLAKDATKTKSKESIVVTPHIYMENVSVAIKDKTILKDITLRFETGLHVITGRVGGGKSSLLKTILQDYPVSSGTLKVQDTVSYASEEPWLFPSTLKQNILFGQSYDKKRYEHVLEVCALKQDVETFEKGDETIVDDRGMNLSKGQQARISLARAVYKNSDIYLLDDCLSSLDAHVQEYVFQECIKKYLKDKIVLMISHNERNISQADYVVIMENGTVKSCEKSSEINMEEIEEINQTENVETKTDLIDNIFEDDENEANSLLPVKERKNIYEEKKKKGTVNFDVYLKYCKCGGSVVIFSAICFLFFSSQFTVSYSEKLISKWVNIQQDISTHKLNNNTNTTEFEELLVENQSIFITYSTAVAISTVLLLSRAIAHFNFSSKASVNLHNKMANSITNATMQFFDIHFVGNIINRFSKDLGTIDEYLPFVIYECLRLICFIGGIIILIASVNSLFLIPSFFLFIKLYIIRRLYLPTARSLKRLDSSTRSPVLSHLNGSLEGITTIHAYGTEAVLREEFDRHQDLHTSTYHMAQCTQRFFAYSLDMMCTIFVTGVILKFLIFKLDAGSVGLAITQALALTGVLQWAVRQWAELETQMTSVERILEYSTVKTEDKSGLEPEDWPNKGKIVYDNVNLTYGHSRELVLKSISFDVNPNEKIGIVGRTGAGKSSIISTLFRLYDFDGKISIDGVDIKTLQLKHLRSHIAIIPQDPMLFSGTLRINIDPYGLYKDEDIWKAIKIVGINNIISSLDEKITESGLSFSAGQKQLLCLARAIVSQNKIIVLDEATANMDPSTDALIHATIQKNFAKCTVLTIAHRLHSVLNSDKVMVVDKGAIVEFDNPQELLKNTEGIFYKMVKRANLLE